MTRVAPAAVGAALLALGAAGCQSTQDRSAELAKASKGLVEQKGLSIAASNPNVTVSDSAVLQDANGTAAVVRLRNRGATQAAVPVLIAVSGKGGKQLYSNAVSGLDRSLVSVASIARGAETYWVDNQVTAAAKPTSVKARVGLGKGPAPATLPRMELSELRYGSDSDGVFARGIVANRSKLPQLRLVISCVSRRGSKIVAAGRAIVDRLAPAPTPKPIGFRVYFIGRPRGGTLTCSAPPTVLTGGTKP